MTAPARQQRLDALRRLLAARYAFGILCTAYAVLVLVLMAPVIGASIGADDTYYTLAVMAWSDGSMYTAATAQLGGIFAPDTMGEQPRTVPLAHTIRWMLALVVLSSAVTFSVPTAVAWAVAKMVLLLLTLASIAALLAQVRFRDADGTVRGVARQTRAVILLAIPLGVALGIKAQSIGGLNGWIDYPVLTYGTVPVIFGTVALALWFLRRLEADYWRWVVPAVVLLCLVGFVLNYSYELVAVAVPVAALAIVLHPRARGGSRWRSWRPAVTVGAALVGFFSALFLFNRWQLSTWPCVRDGSCYGGSVIEIDPLTLWHNLLGAMPSSVTPTIEAVIEETGRSLPPTLTLGGAAIGLLAVASLLATWFAYRAKPMFPSPADEPRGDSKGLVVIVALVLVTGIGVSVVSGMTTRAIEWVQGPELPYRSGPAVWTCLALALVIGVRMLLQRLPNNARVASAVVGVAVVTAASAHLLPLNLAVAQAERATDHTQIVDAIHWDVVLGDLSRAGEAQRCANAAEYIDVVGTSEYYSRTLIGADGAFQHLYGLPYCSATGTATSPQE